MSRLLQLSDLHVVAPGERASGVLDTPALLRTAIDRLLERRDAIGPIDAVLLTGDVSDDGSDESYAFARSELDRLDLPLLAVPGNHDRREGLRAAFAGAARAVDVLAGETFTRGVVPDDASSDGPTGAPGDGPADSSRHVPGGSVRVDTCGSGGEPMDWAVELAGDLVVGLDTLIEGRGGGRLGPSTLAHLERAITDFDGHGIVVALHHPPLRTGVRFMDAIGLENAQELAEVLVKADRPLRVVAGHVHGIHHGLIGGHPVSTAPSICSAFPLDVRTDAPSGFLSGPTGCAVIDTEPPGVWSALTLDPAGALHPFG